MVKFCSACSTEKNILEFRKNSKKKDGRQSMCAICSNAKNREWYANNRDYQLDKKKRDVQRKVQWFLEYKKNLQCARCPESHPRCLDFHHRDPTEKEIGISEAVRSWSIARLKKEITKCEILCSNCHRKETFSDISL